MTTKTIGYFVITKINGQWNVLGGTQKDIHTRERALEIANSFQNPEGEKLWGIAKVEFEPEE